MVDVFIMQNGYDNWKVTLSWPGSKGKSVIANNKNINTVFKTVETLIANSKK